MQLLAGATWRLVSSTARPEDWHGRILLLLFLVSFPCQKLDGCNKMTCTGCMQYFCWLCMGSLSRGNPYRHFNDPSSPCFNRYVFTCVASRAAPLTDFCLSKIILILKFVAIWFKMWFLISALKRIWQQEEKKSGAILVFLSFRFSILEEPSGPIPDALLAASERQLALRCFLAEAWACDNATQGSGQGNCF